MPGPLVMQGNGWPQKVPLGVAVLDENVPVGEGTSQFLNFLGTGVTAEVAPLNPNQINVTIPGGASGGVTVFWDDTIEWPAIYAKLKAAGGGTVFVTGLASGVIPAGYYDLSTIDFVGATPFGSVTFNDGAYIGGEAAGGGNGVVLRASNMVFTGPPLDSLTPGTGATAGGPLYIDLYNSYLTAQSASLALFEGRRNQRGTVVINLSGGSTLDGGTNGILAIGPFIPVVQKGMIISTWDSSSLVNLICGNSGVTNPALIFTSGAQRPYAGDGTTQFPLGSVSFTSPQAVVNVYTTAGRPNPATEVVRGTVIANSTTGTLQWSDGTSWLP